MTPITDTAPVRAADSTAARTTVVKTVTSLQPRKPSRWRWVLVILTLGAVSLAGCASEPGSQPGGLHEHTITLTDGRTVTCVTYSAPYKGGLSCDWDGAGR